MSQPVNTLARGMIWRRQIARIAERRSARRKEKKTTSAPSTPPAADQFVAQTGIGSPAVIAESFYFPQTLINWSGYEALPISMDVLTDWPLPRDEYLTTIGAPPPMVTGERPPL